MLHSYAFSNFQSFRNRTEIDLTLNLKTTMTDWMCETSTGERVSKLMAVIGHNAGGKTALIKALVFLNWFVCHSFRALPKANIPIAPHFNAENESTEFEAIVDFDNKVWRYVLHCTQQRVIHEALYQKKDRFNYVFVRDWDQGSNSYHVKQQEFGFPQQEVSKLRPNASLISTAAQYGVPLATRLAGASIVTNVYALGKIPMGQDAVLTAAEHFSASPTQNLHMNRLLSAWDLGLVGVEFKEILSPTEDNPAKKVLVPFGRHMTKAAEKILPFTLESNGTQSAFVLLSRLLQALEIGGIAVIDEFENDLHPQMLEPILDLFADPKTNPKNAQLLFTCHSVEILNFLHKSQVMLVEKNADCESSSCRLDAVEGVRNDDNYYAKYMSGAYGAVPNF